MDDKGKYYNIIANIIGMNPKTSEGGVGRLYKEYIKGIYDSIYNYIEEGEKIDKNEFIFSMRWVLADMFGGGCEVEEPEGLFDAI